VVKSETAGSSSQSCRDTATCFRRTQFI